MLSTPDCAGYVKSLIKQAEEDTRHNPPELRPTGGFIPYNSAEFTNPLDRLDEFHFTIGDTAFGGEVTGSLREKNATAHLMDLWNDPKWKSQSAGAIEDMLALIALHKLIHLAGTNSSTGYEDWELAIATSKFPDASPGSVEWGRSTGEYSNYWNKELLLHCNFKKK